MLQQHTRGTQGKEKTENATRNHLGDGKYEGTAKQHMCHESIKTTHPLSGVAKYKGYTSQHINRMCHGCIKTTRLLLGVAKYKESKKDDEMTYDMKGNKKIRSAISQNAYSWESPNTRSTQTNI